MFSYSSVVVCSRGLLSGLPHRAGGSALVRQAAGSFPRGIKHSHSVSKHATNVQSFFLPRGINTCAALSTYQKCSQPLFNSYGRISSRGILGQNFHTSVRTEQEEKQQSPNGPKSDKERPRFGEQMGLRLVNENGFLSWTRNSYLSAAVGVGMLNGANDDLMHNAGAAVLLVSAMNMAWGSTCHFTNLIRIRNRISMSRPVLFLNLLGTVVHALLWLFTIAYYLHFLARKHKAKSHSHHHHYHHHPIDPASVRDCDSEKKKI